MARATDEDVIGHDAAAERVGLNPSTWRGYVARGHARVPQPYRVEAVKGHALPVWKADVLDEWKRNRPGPGWHGPHKKPEA